MKTAIVLLNWNGIELLKKFLPSVVKHSAHCAEIFVADNASIDNSLQFLKENHPAVKVIELSENTGFAGGYNKALEQICADYYILLNTDVEVTSGWIEPVITFMDADKTVAACQPKIKSYYQQNLFEYAGAAGGFIDKLGYPFCRGRIFNSLEDDLNQYNDTREIFWASGACMFIRANVFHELGGFDTDFFAHMEEIDLCWRIQNSRKKIVCMPQSEVYHVGGGTLPKKNPQKTYLNFRNNLMMIHKNLPSSNLWYVILLRLLLDGIAGLQFLVKGNFADVGAILRAHFYFYAHFKSRTRLRKQTQLLVKGYNKKNIYPKSIVAQYYLKRKRYFSELNF